MDHFDQDGVGSDRGGQYRLNQGSLRVFDAADAKIPVEVLAAHVAKKSDLLHHVNPSVMETLVAAVFRDFFSCEVTHCGRSHDGGVDLLLVQGDQTIPIQVKRHAKPDAVEQVKVVREMFGVLFRDGYKRGMVVSTAKRFSPEAIKEVNKVIAENRCDTFELVDLDRFAGMLRLVRNPDEQPPWLDLLPRFRSESAQQRFLAGLPAARKCGITL